MPERDRKPTGFEDLSAHTYTGKGLRAKHLSQIVHEKNTFSGDAAEQSFQMALVEKLEADYQAAIDQLARKRDENAARFEEYKKKAGALYEDNDAILTHFQAMLRQQETSRQEAAEAQEKRSLLQGDLERTRGTLSTVDGELEREKAALESARGKLERNNQELVELTQALDEAQAASGPFANAKVWYCKRKLESRQNTQNELTEQFAHHSQLVDRYTARKALTEKQVDALSQQIDVLQETAQNARAASEEYGSIATAISSAYAMRFTENYQDTRARDYLEAYGAKQEKETVQQELAESEDRKQTVKKQVQNAEILDMARTGADQTVRAISIDGKMYYDNSQLTDGGQADGPRVAESGQVADKIEQSEEKCLLEEEKVISQLKRLPVFQYMNSDTLMEYMEYDERQGDFIFRQPRQNGADGQAAQPSLETLARLGLTDDAAFENESVGSLERMIDGLEHGITNTTALVTRLGLDAAAKATGCKEAQKAKQAAAVNDRSGADSNRLYACGKPAQLAAIGANALLFKQMQAAGLGDTFNHIGTQKLLGLDLLGDAKASVASGAGALIGMIWGSHMAARGFSQSSRQTDYSGVMKQKGLQRFGRVMDHAAAENRVIGLTGAAEAGMAGLSAVLSLTGVGGLVVTGASAGMKVLIKAVGGYLIRKGTSQEILNSPQLLGGLHYDKNIIDEDHFNALFAQVTGLNQPDDLAATLKVVDGIDLHRGARRSLLIPDPELDRAMAQLGYPDPLMYGRITLKDLHEKIGMTKDWRKTLRNAIEIKGLDYNTGWTEFVKGLTGNRNHYADQKRITRKEMAAQRRAALAKQAKKKAPPAKNAPVKA